ncbi:MAG: hypothetical protein KDI50_07610 [Candidatus Competibacteraceae bacterium]|nr:hypothetical protein [Candidatus Competibacteraceae bacterium]
MKNPFTKNDADARVTGILQSQTALQEECRQLEREFAESVEAEQQCSVNIQHELDSLTSYLAHCEQFGKPPLQESERRAQLAALETALAAETARQERLNDEVRRCQAALKQSQRDNAVSLDDLRSLAGQRQAAESEITKIGHIIEEQRSKLSDLKADDLATRCAEQRTQVEDLLADQAAGTENAAALQKAQTELAKLDAQSAALNVSANDIRQTLAGLDRRLKVQQTERERLGAAITDATDLHLGQRIDQAVADYLTAVAHVGQTLAKLEGLNQLVNAVAYGRLRVWFTRNDDVRLPKVFSVGKVVPDASEQGKIIRQAASDQYTALRAELEKALA